MFLAALAPLTPYLAAGPASVADVDLARRFPNLGWQGEWGGGWPLWLAGPVGLPALTALAARTGLSFEWAHLWVTAVLYALGAVGVFYLARRLTFPATWTAFAFLLAPNRWSDLVQHGNAPHAVALALLPFAFRFRLIPLIALFWLPFPPHWNPLAALEAALALGAGWLSARVGRTLPVAASVAIFAAGLSWNMLFARPDPPPQPSLEMLQWLAQHAPGEPVLGLLAPESGFNPIRRQAESLILGPDRLDFSLLWLRALGVAHLVTPDPAKFAFALEPEHDDEHGNRVYHTSVRQVATAVMVSRHQWQRLPPLTSLWDRTALTAYVEWADRREAAGFRWGSTREAEVFADLGPDDILLIRQNASPGWRAALDGKPLAWAADPIGFLVIDPGRTGAVTILLTAPSTDWKASVARLPTHAVPRINAGAILDGTRHTPPPFAPGTVITIYGIDLAGPSATRVLAAGRPCEVLYAGEHQVNARLPLDLPRGRIEIAVEFGGGRSNAVGVEIQ